MRTNGLQRPYNAMQISAWILFPLLNIQFFTCLSPVLPSLATSLILSIIFGVTGLVGVYMGYKASVIDPVDANVKEAAAHEDDNDDEEVEVEANTKFCWVCQTRVHEKSMHCKFCDKCVHHFDHHCQWLNTCVGKANYKYFFGTLCALSAFLCIDVAVSLYIIITYFMQRKVSVGPTYDKLSTIYGGGNDLALIIIILVVLVLVVFFVALLFQLLFFHIMLQRKGITTYEFIVRDNALKREHEKKEREISSLRTEMITERKANGKCAWGLSLAKYCPICDPVRQKSKDSSTTTVIEHNGNGHNAAVDDEIDIPSDHPESLTAERSEIITISVEHRDEDK